MGELSALTSMLTRYYIFGFAAPIFAWLVVLDFTLTAAFKPPFFEVFGGAQFVALAGATLVVTLLVVPWRNALYELHAGGLDANSRWPGPHLFPYGREIKKWRAEITAEWPNESYEELWPRARSLMTKGEEALLDQGVTDATALLVTASLALLTTPIVLADFGLHRHPAWWWWLLVPLLSIWVFLICYHRATKVAARNGQQVKAIIKAHEGEASERRNA